MHHVVAHGGPPQQGHELLHAGVAGEAGRDARMAPMALEDALPHPLPSPGRLNGRCGDCHTVGFLEIRHLPEWVHPPAEGWEAAGKSARLAQNCHECGGTELAPVVGFTVVPLASLAGVTPKAAMREAAMMRCAGCGHGEEAQVWAWMVCRLCRVGHRAEIQD